MRAARQRGFAAGARSFEARPDGDRCPAGLTCHQTVILRMAVATGIRECSPWQRLPDVRRTPAPLLTRPVQTYARQNPAAQAELMPAGYAGYHHRD